MVAVGTAGGAAHVLRLSAGLAEAVQNEKQGVNAMLERETLREKNLDKAAKEAKIKARREAARAADLGAGVSDQDLADLEDEFWRATGVEGGARLRLLGSLAGGEGGGGGAEAGEARAAAAGEAADGDGSGGVGAE
ncbi:hypothetical protein MNEG_6355 [Monoraphidium neglectum]|uniref:Uncharacterized protein n=1 Tax=Monoraphidium neglectum TaxID=145388 RepID=A0A0D2MEQ2_9CHLO|nr:hypothetical protein MNEG_6355 [Monoraphidium neglectum]KIZ01610.1 hypothetical protein MNEG_6355 [Monoraphidium neglectum]|eukprot:XP_013900629.1 hypothetical protein MNEG_6355 [Monoraphidium neglectum]